MLLTTTNTFSQISHGGMPLSWHKSMQIVEPKPLTLPTIVAPNASKSTIQKNGSFTFAELIELNKWSYEVGNWTILPGGDKLWMLRLKSGGAYSLNFTFDKYLLPEGAQLFVYTPDHKHKLGAFTYKNNKPYGSLAIAAIPGDEIIIEYYEPVEVEFEAELKIGSIGHDYLNIFGSKDGQYGASDTCNIDVNCEEGKDWQKHKQAVVRIISHNTGLCSGTVLNNARYDKQPIVLTASHCFINKKTPENSVFYFNYESPGCNGPDGETDQTISGAILLADKEKDNGYLDFSLIKLSEQIPEEYEPYFAGWDATGNAPQSTVCIHHPWGDVKKISLDYDPSEPASYLGYGYDPNTFWQIIRWDAGMTQGGSSGSPLFDQNGRVVGSLSGGDAAYCSDEPVNDYYQMLSVAYDKYLNDSMQMKAWLDPDNSGIRMLNAYGNDTIIPSYELKVVPNPVLDGKLTVQLKELNGNKIFLNIYNNMGGLVMQKQLTNNNTEVDVTALSTGMYLFSIESTSELLKGKFIKY